jgi:hypothetical protein
MTLNQYLIGPGLCPNAYPNRRQREQKEHAIVPSPPLPASFVGTGTRQPCSAPVPDGRASSGSQRAQGIDR